MPWPNLSPTLLTLWALLAAFAFAATQIAFSFPNPHPHPGPHYPPNSPNSPSQPGTQPPGTLGAVASENKLCSEIGIALLRAGGNAADALVGISACVGVVGMYHSGIGGGGFMLVRGKNGAYEVIDAREVAPMGAREDMFKGNVEGSVKGGLAR